MTDTSLTLRTQIILFSNVVKANHCTAAKVGRLTPVNLSSTAMRIEISMVLWIS